MNDFSLDEFKAMVMEALEDLPERFQSMLENVAVVVEDEPSPEDLAHLEMDPEDGELLGLYHGVPLTDRDVAYTGLPDRVFVYRGPILRCCASADEVRQQVRETVIHEIGHHVGLGDDEMVF
jgi:predicted Zn-dependent protease with MMP-like domain